MIDRMVQREESARLKDRPPTWQNNNGELAMVVVVAAMALLLRILYARAIQSPALDDPAYYLKVAQNIAEGRGQTIAVIWNYSLSLATVSHPANEYWMPLTSWVIALFYLVFGVSFGIAQIPGVVAGTGLSVMAYYYAKQVFRDTGFGRYRRLAFAVGMLTAANGLLSYEAVLGDSPTFFAFFVLAALIVAGRSVGELPALRGLSLGVLMGLAYLARSHAVFLIGAWLFLLVLSLRSKGKRRASFRSGLLTLLGFMLVVGPWLIRNFLAFGHFSSPATYQAMFLVDYLDFFNFASLPNWTSFSGNGLAAIAASKLDGLWRDFLVETVVVLPSSLLAWTGLIWLALKHPRVRLGLLGAAFLYLGLSVLFSKAAVGGGYYHSIAASLPLFYVGMIYVVARFGLYLKQRRGWQYDFVEVMWVGVLLLVLGQVLVAIPTTVRRHQAEEAQFAAIASWLQQHPASVVMTTQPSTLNYVSDVPAIRLPSNESPSVAIQAAQRYGARYLIITEHSGLYPEVLAQQPDPRFVEVLNTDDAWIYELRY